MGKIMLAALTLVAVMGDAVAQDTYRRGYTRQDGTYVQPHHQTRPDSNPWNNYSTQGNVNPYTGRQGTVDPYAQPRSSYGSGSYGSGSYGSGNTRRRY